LLLYGNKNINKNKIQGENMQMKELVLKEIGNVPEEYLVEVLDFIRFLKSKALDERMVTAIASESSLKKDWLMPEEEEAWQDL
jgi:hypothetical protein